MMLTPEMGVLGPIIPWSLSRVYGQLEKGRGGGSEFLALETTSPPTWGQRWGWRRDDNIDIGEDGASLHDHNGE